MSQITSDLPYRVIETSYARKALIGLAILALGTVAVSAGGRHVGNALGLAGRTTDATVYRITIANETVEAPANMIRQERARRGGMATRLDLYLRWPDMNGYTTDSRASFDNAGSDQSLIFVSFEPRVMSRDMSGRLEPVYRALLDPNGTEGPGSTVSYGFEKYSGYGGEELVVGQRDNAEPFVARCLAETSAANTIAPCERDVGIGKSLSLTYRFSRNLLADWQKMDAAVIRAASAMVRKPS